MTSQNDVFQSILSSSRQSQLAQQELALLDMAATLRRIEALLEPKPVVQPGVWPASPQETRALTIPPGAHVMMDDNGPLIIRFTLPFNHGTVIYRREPAGVHPGGFVLSYEDVEGKGSQIY
jgi:hypothetical protein